MKFSFLLTSTALGLSFIAANASATQVPTSINPSKLEERFERPPTIAPSKAPIAVHAPKPAAKPQGAAANKRFVLRNVVIEGSTVYTPQQLNFTYKNMIGKETSLAEAQSIASRITSYYRRHDYILSRAVVEPSSHDGVVTVRVVEGYVNNVVFTGDVETGAGRKILDGYAADLKNKRPLKTTDMERTLLLLSDLAGTKATGLLRPSATGKDAAELVVTLKHTPYEAYYTLDNRGSKLVGPWEHTVSATANSLFGLYDRTTVRAITTSPTSELRFFDLLHEEPIGNKGTKAEILGSYSTTDPGDSLKSSHVNAMSDALALKVLHPFIRTREESFTGRATIDMRNTDVDINGATPVNRDRMRTARLGGTYDFADHYSGVNLIDTEISQGLSWFNASDSGAIRSNPLADSNFTKINLDVYRTQILPHNLSLLAAGRGQYSSDPLLASEQFSLGGADFGQAYDPSELSGDQGIAGKVELRYSQGTGMQYLSFYQPYAFYDIGRVWLRGVAAGVNDKKSLASTGIGVRAIISPNVYGNLQAAVPMTKPANNQGGHADDARLFLSLTAHY